MSWVLVVVALVTAQRLAELALAQRNEARLRAKGGSEVGAAHYPLFVMLHVVWLASLVTFVPWDKQPAWLLLALYVALQAGRIWVIRALGERWTTRVIVVPGAPLVHSGPYRWVRHPNYLVVALEVPLLPLMFDAWALASLFGCANLALLAYRVRIEDAALDGNPTKSFREDRLEGPEG
jgi:methyltransferase